MGLFSFLFPSRFKSPKGRPPTSGFAQPEASFVVHVSDTEVRCEHPDGRVERIAWDDLQAVLIHTTADGPVAPDVFWILAGTSSSSGCVIPQGATGDRALLEHLQKLPGFDNEAFICAMSSTDEQKFLCWKRSIN
jgi:hypothetical protein